MFYSERMLQGFSINLGDLQAEAQCQSACSGPLKCPHKGDDWDMTFPMCDGNNKCIGCSNLANAKKVIQALGAAIITVIILIVVWAIVANVVTFVIITKKRAGHTD